MVLSFYGNAVGFNPHIKRYDLLWLLYYMNRSLSSVNVGWHNNPGNVIYAARGAES